MYAQSLRAWLEISLLSFYLCQLYVSFCCSNIECGKFYCVIPSFVRGPIDRDLFYLTPATNETCVVQVRNPDIGFIDTTYVSQWMGCADNSKVTFYL